MPLTNEEINMITSCKYFSEWWGDLTNGLCPAGLIAESRGVKFSLVDGYYSYDLRNNDEAKICWQAIDEVADWLGLTRTSFLDSLPVDLNLKV